MPVTDHETFLRGIQLTGPDGAVEFLTIFPGFYQGRTNHIHFKVRLGGHPEKRTYAAGHTSHVGQVFFPEPVAAKLMQQGPYADHKIHRVTETEDGIFQHQHGSASMADVTQGHNELLATLKIAVDPTATPTPVQGFGGPPR
jgi:protocatechuate 3,4-dioxygenase beta subunit